MTLRPLPVPRLGFRPCGLRRRRWSIVGLAAFDSPVGPSSGLAAIDSPFGLFLRLAASIQFPVEYPSCDFTRSVSGASLQPCGGADYPSGKSWGHCCLPGFFRFAVPRGSAETKLEKWGRPSWNDGLALLPIFIHHCIRLLFPCGIRGFLPWPFQVLPSVSVRPFLARNQRLCSFPESRQRNQPVDN